MELSKRGRHFIEGYETCVLYVYDDARAPVKGVYREWRGEPVKGTLTAGFGHTDKAKHPLKLTQGLRLTREEADEILSVDLHECIEQVELELAMAGNLVTQGQFDALVSFNFNCGAKNLKNLLKPLRDSGDYKATGEKFELYVFTTIGGKRVRSRGLARRREGEEGLWNEKPVRTPRVPVHHQADVHAEQVIVEPAPMPKSTLPKPEVKTYVPVAPEPKPIEVAVKKRMFNGTFVWIALMIGAISWAVMQFWPF